MSISFEELAALLKGIPQANRQAFKNALIQVVADKKDEKSSGASKHYFAALKYQITSPTLKPLLEKLIADFDQENAALKKLFNNEIVQQNSERFIALISVFAEENSEEHQDEKATTALSAPLLKTPEFQLLGSTHDSLGLIHLKNRRYEQVFWHYICEHLEHQADIPFDTLGFCIVAARDDLFADPLKIKFLKDNQAIIFSALVKCYQLYINKQDLEEVEATLVAYTEFLELLHANDFSLASIIDLINELSEVQLPFGSLIYQQLENDHYIERYEKLLQALYEPADDKLKDKIAALRMHTKVAGQVVVQADAKLADEIEGRLAQTGSAFYMAIDTAHELQDDSEAGLSRAVSLAPSRESSTQASPRVSRRGTFFTVNPPPASPHSRKPSHPPSPGKK